MIRLWLVVAAIGGFLSVAAGGAAAHLAATERPAELLRTGAPYGMVHAVALIAVTAIAKAPARGDLALTSAGTALFSLSLFALALTGRYPTARINHAVRWDGPAPRLGRARYARDPSRPLERGARRCSYHSQECGEIARVLLQGSADDDASLFPPHLSRT